MAEGWISPTPPSLDHGAGEDRSRSLSGFEFYACANANGSIALGVHVGGGTTKGRRNSLCSLENHDRHPLEAAQLSATSSTAAFDFILSLNCDCIQCFFVL